MDIHFDCTACGKCCHDLKLPLSFDEAIAWTRRGGEVQLLSEAIPWIEEPAPEDDQARYKQDRSFPAQSGTLPTRIAVVLAAAFDGPCPYLNPIKRCGIYEDRPAVCRIYPAEINPFVALAPATKACPPEAWTEDQPLLSRNDAIVDRETLSLIAQSRAAAIADARLKARLCANLGITVAALANEGFVVHSPAPADMLIALEAARSDRAASPPPDWTVLSNRNETVAMLTGAGASGALTATGDERAEYLGFFPAS